MEKHEILDVHWIFQQKIKSDRWIKYGKSWQMLAIWSLLYYSLFLCLKIVVIISSPSSDISLPNRDRLLKAGVDNWPWKRKFQPITLPYLVTRLSFSLQVARQVQYFRSEITLLNALDPISLRTADTELYSEMIVLNQLSWLKQTIKNGLPKAKWVQKKWYCSNVCHKLLSQFFF